MTIVRPFEGDMLHLLHAILGRAPVEQAEGILLSRRERPACLGREALRLIGETLARGCVRRLARDGGWIRERYLRADRAVEGRLWERTPPSEMGLEFTTASIDLLAELVAEAPGREPSRRPTRPSGAASGDALLGFLACEALGATRGGEMLRSLPMIRRNALCRLAFPVAFAGQAKPDPLDFSGWAGGPHSWLLEALQGRLATAWVEGARAKRVVSRPDLMIAMGREQARVLDAYLPAVEAAGRRDLARFLPRALGELLRAGAGPEWWAGSMETQGMRLADRAEALRAALEPVPALERLRAWEAEARGVGYFDEGYAAAQLGKSDWERAGGEELCGRARTLLRAADPLGTWSR